MKTSATWDFEFKYKSLGLATIAGLDEVGRGAWAGPLVALAYIFQNIPTDITVFDSKSLSSDQRVSLACKLKTVGIYGIGEVSPQEIDFFGLQSAQYLAYNRALDSLPLTPDILLLDGRPWKSCPVRHEAVIKGDAKIASIAAASIMAKVHRDNYMKNIAHQSFPNYHFDKHVGYGTNEHRLALDRYGATAIHRQSYSPIKAYL